MRAARPDPPADPERVRLAGVRHVLRRTAAAASRVAAPVVWLLAGGGLLLVVGDPHRPWVGPREVRGGEPGGPAASPPLFAWLSFSPGASLGRTLREDGLRVGFAGPPRAVAPDADRPEFAPPPRELWPPGWGVDAFVHDPWARGVAQRVASLRFSGWYLAAFVPAFAAVWWTVAFFLRKRREGRGEPLEPDRRPGRFALLWGVLRPWVLLAAVAGAAVAGAAELWAPLATLAECAGAGTVPVGMGIDPPWHFGEPGESAAIGRVRRGAARPDRRRRLGGAGPGPGSRSRPRRAVRGGRLPHPVAPHARRRRMAARPCGVAERRPGRRRAGAGGWCSSGRGGRWWSGSSVRCSPRGAGGGIGGGLREDWLDGRSLSRI